MSQVGKGRTSSSTSDTAQLAAQGPPLDLSEAPPNQWYKIREHFREPAAEFLGTMIFITLGCGSNCQAVLSSSTAISATPKGNWLSLSFGWAAGLSLGVWISAGVSGGHINPAVTIAFATFRDFPWRKVPYYILAQVLGAICGAGMVYGNYYRAIDLFEGGPGIRTVSGTAGLFGTYAASYVSASEAFFTEFLGSAILILVILGVTDKYNKPPPPGLVGLMIFIVILGVAVGLGMETGFALNPARDFGPRILTAMAGYGRGVFNFRHQYWLWCPILAPILGMLCATFVYDLFIYTGPESILGCRLSRNGRPRRVVNDA